GEDSGRTPGALPDQVHGRYPGGAPDRGGSRNQLPRGRVARIPPTAPGRSTSEDGGHSRMTVLTRPRRPLLRGHFPSPFAFLRTIALCETPIGALALIGVYLCPLRCR